MATTRRILMVGFPILAILLSSCSATPTSTSTPQAETTSSAPAVIVAEGRLEPIRFADLALNTSGLVSEVLHKEGDPVKAGEVIARLENTQARTLESAKADALQRIN